jgi:hypothetical protein
MQVDQKQHADDALAAGAIAKVRSALSIVGGVQKICIEFAHTYIDETPGSEQRVSSYLANALTKHFAIDGITVRSVVLLDDYNPVREVTSPQSLEAVLAEMGSTPDFIASESALVPLAAELINRGGRACRSARRFHDRRGRMPCSALVAAWNRMRLASHTPPMNLLYKGTPAEWSEGSADLVVTLLPARYAGVEAQADAMVGETMGAEDLKRFVRIYHPSPVDPTRS